jgi:hypothetical protein
MIIESYCGYKIDRQAKENEEREKSLLRIERELIVHRSCRNELLMQQRERKRHPTTGTDSKILMALFLLSFSIKI